MSSSGAGSMPTPTRRLLATPARRVHDFAALVAGTGSVAPRCCLRPSALDRLLERHDRPAEADRPRPRRHHARVAEVDARCTTMSAPARSPATATTGTARPAGSCGTADARRCSAASRSASTTAARPDRRAASPAPRARPTGRRSWRFVADAGVTFFGAGAAFYASCHEGRRRAGARRRSVARCGRSARPARRWRSSATMDLRELPRRTARRSGSPRSPAAPTSPAPSSPDCATLPVVDGEMQCRCLGAAVEAWWEPDANGRARSLIDEVGELVCIKPMPSMPLYFWGDEPPGRKAGSARQLLRHVSGHLAPWRLAAHHAARRRDHLRPQRRDHQPPRHPHGNGRALPRGRGHARSDRQPGRRSRVPRPRELHAALRRSARGRRARRCPDATHEGNASSRRSRRATCRTRSSR